MCKMMELDYLEVGTGKRLQWFRGDESWVAQIYEVGGYSNEEAVWRFIIANF